MWTVRYPARCSQTGSVFEWSSFSKPPDGAALPMTVWLWAYWPVRKVDRDGQQSGNDAKLFWKVVPSAARSARTFVITRTDSTVWSSVMAPSTRASKRADPLTLRPCQTSVRSLLAVCSDQRTSQLGGFGHRRAAREVLAHIDGRPAVDEVLALEERHAVRGPDGDDDVRVEARESRSGDLAVGRADDRELSARREVEVERRERPAKHERDARRCAMDEAEDGDGVALELVVAVDARKAQEHPGQHPVSRGRRLVLEILPPRDEILARGEIEAATLFVGEQLDGQARQPVGLHQPAELARRDVEFEETVRDVGVVGQEALRAGATLAPRPVEPSFVVDERGEQELGQANGGVTPVVAVKSSCGLGERREEKAVPRRDDLVVAGRPGAALSFLEEPRPQLGLEPAANDRAPVLERRQELFRDPFLGRPREGQALDAVGIGVLRRCEPALGKRELAQDVLERLLDDLAVALVARDDPGVQVVRGQQRVVVEHLLEMRHEPVGVDRIAMEAAAHEVVHPAGGHPVESLHDHRERLFVAAEVHPQEELEH